VKGFIGQARSSDILTACVCAAIVGAFIGCNRTGKSGNSSPSSSNSQSAASSSSASLAKVGQRVEAEGRVLTVQKIERVKSLGVPHKPAGAGKTYLVVDLILETATNDEALYNAEYFKVKDSDGVETKSEESDFAGSFWQYPVPKGEKAPVKVAFEIKEAAKGLVLMYQATGKAGGAGEMRVDLGDR
jgi:hypothetical protein